MLPERHITFLSSVAVYFETALMGVADIERVLPSPLAVYLRNKNQKGAENICKQLGYTGGTSYTAGGGMGPINAGNRLCEGGEKTIFDCKLRGERNDLTGCNHDHDQGVHCTKGGEEKLFFF